MQELSHAKTAILLRSDTAFYGSLLLAADAKYGETPKGTACTDGKSIIIDQVFFHSLPEGQQVFLLLHEIVHIAFQHPLRRGERDPQIWQRAVDEATNNLLVDQGFEFIPGGWLTREYRNMSAEEIYEDLLQNQDEGKGGDGGIGEDIVEPETPEELQKIQQEVTDKIVAAVQQAQMQGQAGIGSIPGDLLRMVEELLAPVFPWEVLVEQYATEKAKSDYSWRRRKRRYPDIVVPSLYSERMGTIAVYVDASCSVSNHELTQYVSEIKSIRDKLNPALLEVISFDTRIQEITAIRDTDPFDLEIRGGGGTSLREVAERINEQQADINILFTDGYYHPVEYNKEVLHIIINNPDYTNEDHPVIHIKI